MFAKIWIVLGVASTLASLASADSESKSDPGQTYYVNSGYRPPPGHSGQLGQPGAGIASDVNEYGYKHFYGVQKKYGFRLAQEPIPAPPEVPLPLLPPEGEHPPLPPAPVEPPPLPELQPALEFEEQPEPPAPHDLPLLGPNFVTPTPRPLLPHFAASTLSPLLPQAVTPSPAPLLPQLEQHDLPSPSPLPTLLSHFGSSSPATIFHTAPNGGHGPVATSFQRIIFDSQPGFDDPPPSVVQHSAHPQSPPFVHLPRQPSATPFVHPSPPPFVHPSPTPFVHPSPTPFVHPSPTPFVHPSPTPFIHSTPTPFAHPSPTQSDQPLPAPFVHPFQAPLEEQLEPLPNATPAPAPFFNPGAQPFFNGQQPNPGSPPPFVHPFQRIFPEPNKVLEVSQEPIEQIEPEVQLQFNPSPSPLAPQIQPVTPLAPQEPLFPGREEGQVEETVPPVLEQRNPFPDPPQFNVEQPLELAPEQSPFPPGFPPPGSLAEVFAIEDQRQFAPVPINRGLPIRFPILEAVPGLIPEGRFEPRLPLGEPVSSPLISQPPPQDLLNIQDFIEDGPEISDANEPSTTPFPVRPPLRALPAFPAVP